MTSPYAKAQPGHLTEGHGLMHASRKAPAASRPAGPVTRRERALGMQDRCAPLRNTETYPFDLGWEPEKEVV